MFLAECYPLLPAFCSPIFSQININNPQSPSADSKTGSKSCLRIICKHKTNISDSNRTDLSICCISYMIYLRSKIHFLVYA